ncbi:MAG: SiaB family protein kinase [Bacteroidota bacterium]|nr:SiaB family protein kinase [Bacteroidota bacterium]
MQLKEQVINDTSQLPLIVYYKGNYEDISTETLINIIESNEKLAKRKSQLRKVMFLSVEAIQNIQRYSAHKGNEWDHYLLFFDGDSYQVVTQNLIHNKDSQSLKDKLDVIVSKDQTELDELYFKKIESGEATEKGAGLGLIEITRKSNKSIRYEIKKVDEEYSLFNLYFAIPIAITEETTFDFSKAINIQAKLDQFSKGTESCFYYGGDFSNSFIASLLDLLVSKKAEKNDNTNKKVHHILIELTQNIKKHAQFKNENARGRIFIEWNNQHIEVSTYNNTHLDNAKELQKKVVNLNGANKEQLVQKSKDVLADLDSANGLGLIDVANLIYPNKMNVTVCNESNDHVGLLFSIKINNE